MYKVEYLILLDNAKTKCRTVHSLKKLLESDAEIEIDKNKISYHNYTCALNIQLGTNANKAHLFFDITLRCEQENDIEKFSELLKAVRTVLSLITTTQYVIWDDLSLFYASKAYPLIFDIENLMRQLITKFMLTNIGVGWTSERVPTDVMQSINANNKDLNYLHNVDFIQLKHFLFSENYPNHRESLLKKLKTAEDFSTLDLKEIKTLIPDSNWNKYFEPIVGCDAEYLKKRWDKLYDLRINIAHNKSFTKHNLEETVHLCSELKPHLQKALTSLDEIVLTPEERENIAETVAISRSEQFGEFIIRFRHLEDLMLIITKDIKLKNPKEILGGYIMQNNLLMDKGIIPAELHSALKHVIQTRNGMVHSSNIVITADEIIENQKIIEDFIRYLEKYIRENRNGIVQ